MGAVKRTLASAEEEGKKLREIYFNAQHPASFGGIEKLRQMSKAKEVQKFLKKQWAYTLHKPIRQKFLRRKYVVRGINKQWQVDLVEMQQYSKVNQGYRYILCVIDIFSRYAYARPLKTKTGIEVAEALQSVFNEAQVTPNFIQADQGLEFYNQHVQKLLQKHSIELFSVYSEKKAAIVERFQRTLQERLYRAFTYQGNYYWLELLPQLIDSYNHSHHRSIQTKPALVNKKNEADVWLKQYDDLKIKVKPKFSKGDRVRIPKRKTVFTKGYIEKWTDEIFTIHDINTKYNPALYTLIDDDGEIIKGSFYEQELQKVDDDLYRIERVIRYRTINKHRLALVQWKGYREPTWIDASHISKL